MEEFLNNSAQRSFWLIKKKWDFKGIVSELRRACPDVEFNLNGAHLMRGENCNLGDISQLFSCGAEED